MSKGKSTSTTSNAIDPQLMNIYKDVYGIGKTIANQPYLPYTGPQVDGFNPDQLAGFDTTRSNYLKSLTADPRAKLNTLMTGGAASFLNPGAAIGEGKGIADYMNPYTTNVVDTTLTDINKMRDMALNRNADSAIAANAFGGSRQGVLESLTNQAAIEQAAKTGASLRSQGYRDAANLMQTDLDRAFRNKFFQGDIAGNILQDQSSQLNNLFNIGQMQQGLQQTGIDKAFGQYQDAIGYGPKQLGLLSQAAGLIPQQNTSTTTGRQETGAGDILGKGAELLATYLMFSSDSRLKENIKSVGKTKSGINLYKWSWNNIAKKLGIDNQPTIGVIAQEVMLSHPQSVVVGDDGYLMVNYRELD